MVNGRRDATDLDEPLRQLLATAQDVAAQLTYPDAAAFDAARWLSE